MPYSADDRQVILDQLTTNLIGCEILIHDCVDSTNNTALLEAQKGIKEGTVILADSQTKGKGRRDREWYSESNVGIYLSTILKPSIPTERMAQITLVAGVALVRAINDFSQAKAFLKWPNDIFLNHKKVAGILTESYPGGDHTGIILGIGINVNHSRFPVSLQHIATSLAMENGGKFERLSLISSLLNHLDKEYRCFLDEGISPAIDQWNFNSEMFGQHVSLDRGTETFVGTAIRLDEEGHLVILLDSGAETAFDSGEVTLLE